MAPHIIERLKASTQHQF